MRVELVEIIGSDYATRRSDKDVMGELPCAVEKGVLHGKRPPRDK